MVVVEVEKVLFENLFLEFISKMEGLMVLVGGVVLFKCFVFGYFVLKFKW